jgi:hypothetical protein
MEVDNFIGICYQARTGKDTECLASAALRSRVCEFPKALQLFVITIYK